MRDLGIFIVLFITLISSSCNNKSGQKVQQASKGENRLASEFEKTIKGINNIDTLYYLTDKYENKLLEENTPPLIMAKFYHTAANRFYMYSKYAVSKEYFKKSEDAYRRAGDTLMSIKMRGNRAVLLDLQGKYKDAVKIFFEISDYFKKTGDTLPLAFAYSNIGVIYEEMKNPQKAILYGKKALELKRLAGDTLHMATNLNNIGVNYDELLHNPDSAIYYYKLALEIYKKFRKIDDYATVLNNLGRMYLEKNDFNKAESSFAKAYGIFDSLGMINDKASVMRNQGQLLFNLGKIDPALKKLRESYDIYKQQGISKGLLEATRLMSEIYMAKGAYGDAAEMMKQYNGYKDSLLSAENQAVIAEMETKYQVKEKNRTILMLQLQEQLHTKKIKLQKMFIVFLSIVFILSVVLFYSHHKRNVIKQQQLRLELQNYLLRMNEMQNKLETFEEDCQRSTTPGVEQLKKFNLTKQEMKVIELIAEGYQNSEIAKKLFVSQNTVKTHIKNIYLKLDVKNRVEALKKVKAG